ncbi:hypothetical protein J6590_085373 [Homalodisca vitripennis]|nr:hypothetical protein J6590_085373 [Homalodisca vitripennis]
MKNNNVFHSRHMQERALVIIETAVIYAADIFGYGSVEDAELTSKWSELDKGCSRPPAAE